MRFPNVPFNLTGLPFEPSGSRTQLGHAQPYPRTAKPAKSGPRDDDLTGARARRAKAASCLTSGAITTDTFNPKRNGSHNSASEETSMVRASSLRVAGMLVAA